MNIIDLIAPIFISISMLIAFGVIVYIVKLNDTLDKQATQIKMLYGMVDKSKHDIEIAVDSFTSAREKINSMNTRADSIEFELKGMREKMSELKPKR